MSLLALIGPGYLIKCIEPHAESVTAELGVDNEGSEKLDVAWMSTVKPTHDTCNFKYCPGSRNYYIKMVVFNSAPLNYWAKPDYETKWKKGQTSFRFSNSRISSEKYFLFQLGNANYNQLYQYLYQRNPTVNSRLFYFGDQGTFWTMQ